MKIKTNLSFGDWLTLLLLPVMALAAYIHDPNSPANHPAFGVIILIIVGSVIWMDRQDVKVDEEHRKWIEAIQRNMRETNEASERRVRAYREAAERFRRQRISGDVSSDEIWFEDSNETSEP